jgi:hypothetical protein
MRLLVTLFLVSGLLLRARAQEFKEGFVKFGKDNYVYGYVWSAVDAQAHLLCMFKENLADSARVYYAADIEGYGILNGGSYVKETVQQGPETTEVFLKVLVDGPVELSMYLMRFFIARSDTVRAELLQANFRTVIKKYVSRCPYLRTHATRVSLTEKSLTTFLRQYAPCLEGDPESFNGSQQRLVVAPHVSAGLNAAVTSLATSSSTHAYLNGLKMTNETPYAAGAGLSLYHTGLRFLRLDVGGIYAPTRYHAVRSEEGYVAEVDLSYNEVRVPIALEFSLLRKTRINPALRAGYVYVHWSKVASTAEVESSSGSTVVIDELQPMANISPPAYLMAGVSVSLPIKAVRGFVSATYYAGSTTFSISNVTRESATADVSALTICLGVSFP